MVQVVDANGNVVRDTATIKDSISRAQAEANIAAGDLSSSGGGGVYVRGETISGKDVGASATPAQVAAKAAVSKQITMVAPKTKYAAELPTSSSKGVSLTDIRSEATLADQQHVSAVTGLPLKTIQNNWDYYKSKLGGSSYEQLTEKGIAKAQETGRGYIGGLGYDLSISKGEAPSATASEGYKTPIASKEVVGGVSLPQGLTREFVSNIDEKIGKAMDKAYGYSTYASPTQFKAQSGDVSTVAKAERTDVVRGQYVELNIPKPSSVAEQEIKFYPIPNTGGKITIPYTTSGDTAATLIARDIDRATADWVSRFERENYARYQNVSKLNKDVGEKYYQNLQFMEGGTRIAASVASDFTKSSLFIVPAAASTGLAASRLIQQTIYPNYEPRTDAQIAIEKRIFEAEKPSYILGTFSFPLTYEAAPKAIVGLGGAGLAYGGEKLTKLGLPKYLASTGAQGFVKEAITNKYILKESGKLLATSIVAAGGISAGVTTDESGGMTFSIPRAAGGAATTAAILYGTTTLIPKAGAYAFEKAPILKNVNNPFIQAKIVPIEEARQMQKAYPELTEAKLKEGSQAVKDMVASAKKEIFSAKFKIGQNEYTGKLNPKQIAALEKTIGKQEKFIESVTKPMIDKEAREAARSEYIKKLMTPVNKAEIGKPMKPYIPPKVTSVPVGGGLKAAMKVNVPIRVQGIIAPTPRLSGLARIRQDIKLAAKVSGTTTQARTTLKTITQSSTRLKQVNIPSTAQITSQVLLQPTIKAQAQSQVQTQAQIQARIQAMAQTQVQTQVQTMTQTRLRTPTRIRPPTLIVPTLKFPQASKKKMFKQGKKTKFKFGYAPSFTASVFGITGKVAKDVLSGKRALTGFEFRPIPSNKGLNVPLGGRLGKVSPAIRRASKGGFKGKFKRFKGFKL